MNASIAITIAAPFAGSGFETWRVAVLVAFFVYNACFRRRCVGCMVVGIWPNRPASIQYVALYTLGLSTCFYWVAFPGDLLLVNLSGQAICLTLTGNTVHGWLSDTCTLRRDAAPALNIERGYVTPVGWRAPSVRNGVTVR